MTSLWQGVCVCGCAGVSTVPGAQSWLVPRMRPVCRGLYAQHCLLQPTTPGGRHWGDGSGDSANKEQT